MRLLLFEFLHAAPEWYRTASVSMRAEGRAMLEAVATDLSLAGVSASIAVCPEARKGLNLRQPTFDVTACTATEFVAQLCDALDFDAVFPIAPESGGTLSALVREFREQDRQVLALPTSQIELFSDKWKTFQFLSDLDLPTPPTVCVEDFRQPNGEHQAMYIVKPRDGAGCDSIEVVSAAELIVREFSFGKHIVQPRLCGQALSVGLIGSCDGGATTVLPPATQRIVWYNNKPAYSGGEIPARLTQRTENQLRQICEQLIKIMKPVVGYVGIDFFLPDGTEQPLIMEINPRLCSSYIGYRQATQANLMSSIFCQVEEISWNTNATSFRCG